MQALRKNNDNMPIFRKNNGNSVFKRFDDKKLAKKLEKSKKLFKSYKSLRFKLLKNRNLSKINIKKTRLSFLIPKKQFFITYG